jgi:arsenate reductase-like glutaredoxin family protein
MAAGPIEVQVFGVKNDAATRKALRFFAERRAKVHFVDLKRRAASRGELRRFAQKFGVAALVNTDAKRYRSLGLAHAHRPDDWWLGTLEDEPSLLTVPLVRKQHQLTIGLAEEEWRRWFD